MCRRSAFSVTLLEPFLGTMLREDSGHELAFNSVLRRVGRRLESGGDRETHGVLLLVRRGARRVKPSLYGFSHHIIHAVLALARDRVEHGDA